MLNTALNYNACTSESIYLSKPSAMVMDAQNLLDLPLELRAKVYQHIFCGSKLVAFHIPDKTNPQWLSSNHCSILQTCKQIYTEALPIYHRHLHVVYDIDLVRRSVDWNTGESKMKKYRVQPLAFGQLLQRRIDTFLAASVLKRVRHLTIRGEKLRMRDWSAIELPALRSLTLKETDAKVDMYRSRTSSLEITASLNLDESYYESHLRTLPSSIHCQFISGRDPDESQEGPWKVGRALMLFQVASTPTSRLC